MTKPVKVSTVHLPENEWQAAKRVCEAQDITFRSFVRRCVRQGVAMANAAA